MTREEAIRHIRDVIAENNSIAPNMVTFKQEKEALYMAIEALKAQTPDNYWYERGFHAGYEYNTAQEWILCSERLPEIYIPVILSGKHNEVIGYRRNDSDWMAFTGDGWETDIEHPEDFIAWMPLPEPYKAESEE